MVRMSLAGALVLAVLLPLLAAAQRDASCLLAIKQSIEDPLGHLASWNTQVNPPRVCGWYGVNCLHPDGNDVISINLHSLDLGGSFPLGLENCTFLMSLDLSNNNFASLIPPTVCDQVPNLVTLDLSNNRFFGPIPDQLAGCRFLNSLQLQNNSLNGTIPGSIGELSRLRDFNVSDNELTGQIPSTFTNVSALNYSSFPRESFLGNGLCGPPLSKACRSGSSTDIGLIVGIAAGAVGLVMIVSGIIVCFVLKYTGGKARRAHDRNREENRWVKEIRAPKSIPVSMFEKPVAKVKLADLMAATQDFSKANIIGAGRTGTVYKATFPDGSVMAIKRLQNSDHTERQFKTEMDTLGMLKHRNLVPLLGYCVANGEKLLVYKHMSKGSLREQLHKQTLEWATRVKIAIGSARGLAWLHHSCNPRITHRNISASCILLDHDYEPRITGFGLARSMNPADTHVSTLVNGDFGDVGYVPPEYMRRGVPTIKGDVYSFGVVLLELVTGQKANDVAVDEFRGNLVEWIIVLSNQGRVFDALDPSLMGKDVDNEVKQILKVASNCTLSPPKERPSMFEVYNLLRAIGEKYHFTDFDDMPMTSESGDAGYSESEVIVSMTR